MLSSMEKFVATTKATQKQLSSLTFAVKASPTFVRLSLPPRSKRPLTPTKRGPGHPRKRLRIQDLVNKWYEAVEQEHDNTSKVSIASCITRARKATDTTLQLGKRSYYRNFESYSAYQRLKLTMTTTFAKSATT